MERRVLISRRGNLDVLALIEDGMLAEVYARNRAGECAVGNIYLGCVQHYDPSLHALFVSIGEKTGGKPAGILTMPKGMATADIPRQNAGILVQVRRTGFGNRGARLTRDIVLPGRYAALTTLSRGARVSRKIEDAETRSRLLSLAKRDLPRDVGWILRTGSADAADDAIVNEARQSLDLWRRIDARSRALKPPAPLFEQDGFGMMAARDLPDGLVECVVDDADLYEECVAAFRLFAAELCGRVRLYNENGLDAPLLESRGVRLDDVTRKAMRLPGGGGIIIEPCETLTAIDVNSSKARGAADKRGSVLAVNLEAAAEIARQMRLRDLGGVIMIDFIDMDSEDDRQKVLDELCLNARRDRSRVFVDGFTKRGLLELTRKSMRCPIHKALAGADGGGA